MKKRFLIFLFFTLYAVVSSSIKANAAELIEGGFCGGEGDGTNLIWELDSDGVLRINGTGAMKDFPRSFSQSVPRWYSHKWIINTVLIGENVIL